MEAEVKKEWIKRLRSGDYTQTIEYLSDGNGHCCLGVLCEIAVEKKITKKRESGLAHKFGGGEKWEDQMPPEMVQVWAGITNHQANVLTEMNDSERDSFETIAAYIEKEF